MKFEYAACNSMDPPIRARKHKETTQKIGKRTTHKTGARGQLIKLEGCCQLFCIGLPTKCSKVHFGQETHVSNLLALVQVENPKVP